MISLTIGISSGSLLILLLVILKRFDSQVICGLILAGIGFLYIGFTWSDLRSLIITAIQAFGFLVLAYYGVKRSMCILAMGYFLHGSWDLAYGLFDNGPGLIPPHYDVFCLSFDFTIGIYLLIVARKARTTFMIRQV